MNSFVAFIAKQYFAADVMGKEDVPIPSSTAISAAAALIYTLIKDNDVLKEHLVSTLTRSTIPALDDSLLARRSIVAALAKDEGKHQRPISRYRRLKYHREAAHPSRGHHKIIRRFGICQTYSRTTTRRYPNSRTVTIIGLNHFSACSDVGPMQWLCPTLTTHISQDDGKVIPSCQWNVESHWRCLYTSSVLGDRGWCRYFQDGR